ncbi:hypothetical protein N781_01190 [Pontibacillus halophilus JSM 076056 = DSM 19796]|uniref:Uncharacterized protein n=1 Tax=Pontibacillus halophilus JSM 076056 = DSM 19796 TaxID=1385510 RepID=A0A0A5GSF3_9BACI|nr:hypothetical protein [Pontibacillus halophilus]KGX94070.1 hypothetical protein N781_01190 [Pontibacillus halophilus JSM 076056 = DSM 19796]
MKRHPAVKFMQLQLACVGFALFLGVLYLFFRSYNFLLLFILIALAGSLASEALIHLSQNDRLNVGIKALQTFLLLLFSVLLFF